MQRKSVVRRCRVWFCWAGYFGKFHKISKLWLSLRFWCTQYDKEVTEGIISMADMITAQGDNCVWIWIKERRVQVWGVTLGLSNWRTIKTGFQNPDWKVTVTWTMIVPIYVECIELCFESENNRIYFYMGNNDTLR